MAKFHEAQKRMFENKFVCKNCKSTIRAPNMLVIAGKVKCRKCGRRALRTLRKK